MQTCVHVGMCVSIWKCMWTHTPICEDQRSNQVYSSIVFHLNFGTGFQNLSLQIRPGWLIHDLKEPVCFCHLYTLAQRLQMRVGTLQPGLTHECCHTHLPMYVPVIQTQPSCLCDKLFTKCTISQALTPDSLTQDTTVFIP